MAVRPKTQSPKQQDFLKRRSFLEGRALIDAAHLVTQRLYCDALRFWRRCSRPDCKRHRRCCGAPTRCLIGGLIYTPPSRRLRARKQVIAGGPRRVAPASHIEWVIRRTDLVSLVSWKISPPEEPQDF